MSTAGQPVRSEKGGTRLPQSLTDVPCLIVPQRWVDLPAGCVVCGVAEYGRLRLKIRKASKLCALVGLMGAVIYFSAPAARLRAGMCKAHWIGEWAAQLFVRCAIWTIVACILVPIAFRSPTGFAMGVIVALLIGNITMIYEIVRNKPLKAVHADRRHVWVANASPVIIDQLAQPSE